MPLFDNVILHKMIVHKVNHIKNTEPKLSDAESPVDNEDVQFFIRRHINNGEIHRYSRSGVFVNSNDLDEDIFNLKEACDDINADSNNFIERTQEIATHLFDSIKGNKSISPGDLIIVTYTNTNFGGSRRIALLKMDPEDGFIGEPEEVTAGVTRIVLRRVEGVLPIENLQKCAFVLPEDDRNLRRELIVLDQQNARRGAMKMAASFFASDFLQCNLGLSEPEQTTAFITTVFDYKKEKEGEWEEGKGETFIESAETILETEQIDVEQFAQANIIDVDQQEEFVLRVKEKMKAEDYGNLIFKPDTSYKTQNRYLVIEGDNELRIRILEQAVGENKTLTTTKEADNRHTIKIVTTKFKQRVTLGKSKQ